MKVKLYKKILKQMLPHIWLEKADGTWAPRDFRYAKMLELARMWVAGRKSCKVHEFREKYKKFSGKYWTSEARMRRAIEGE